MNWYQLDTKEVFKELNTSEKGLTGEEVQDRLAKYGPNKLSAAEKISRLKIIIHQFMSPLIYILLIAAESAGDGPADPSAVLAAINTVT